MSDRLYFGGSMPRHRVVGVISVAGCDAHPRRWQDGGPRVPGHVLFVDYDGRDLDLLRASVGYAQRRFDLSSAHVFRTDKGYHIWFLDALAFQDAAWILSKLPCESRGHLAMGAARGYWTIRITPKGRSRVSYEETIKNGASGRYRQSEAHAWFLHRWGGIPKSLLGLDGPRDNRRWLRRGRVCWEPYETPVLQVE